jgi:t-SNARE complex subunit (syntaxin)
MGSKKKVEDIGHNLHKSERKIKSMMMLIRKNKLVVWGVLAFIVLVLIILLVSYFR